MFMKAFHFFKFFPKLAQNRDVEETPLRAELFSADQMEEHGKTLAAMHLLDDRHVPERLLSRLAENEKVLLDVRALLNEAVKSSRRMAPAGEWLLDNFYLIEEQIQTAKQLLPKGYAKELPHLKNAPSRGLPRVYDIALEAIAHGDGRVDPERLESFVAAYQTVTPLQLGELWAIPIMLRLALIENLRRVAARVAVDRESRDQADYWADRLSETAEKDPKSLILTVADMARSGPPMVSSFVAELARRLQGQGAGLALPLTWIEQQLSESYLTISQLVQSENQQQAADQVSISNSIGTLRFLSAMDWRQFVEGISTIEQILRGDPAGIYDRMDFSTRDQYRHVVEKLARKSSLSEREVALHAIELARTAGRLDDDRESHVGFYLMDAGLPRLEGGVRARTTAGDLLRRTGRRFPLALYLGTIFLFSGILTAALLSEIRSGGTSGPLFWGAGVLLLLCVSQLAVSLANFFSTCLAAPNPLPRMDFSKGIPAESATLVVVPTILSSMEAVGELMDALEVRCLANRDDNLRFGLLTDFVDASEEVLPGDELLLSQATKRISALNEQYGEKGDIFFLFHRPRQWNPQERIWMGYERKRGKLADLNSFLRGGSRKRFSLIVGNTEGLHRVKYIITLDTDTDLPRESAWQLVGAMAHPLNRPRYDAGSGRIVSGYGILQPRMAVSLPGVNRSRYAQLWGSDAGIDPYTRVVSDVYQDLFGEGSYIGKGIYDVDAFEQVLKGCFPENLILSHDLIEGCYVRSGLISDVQLYEAYPPRYSADVSRRARWIRGDWQILQWLFPHVPSHAGFRKNPISALSRWKIFDNLRRSLVPLALCFFLLLGWTVLPSPFFCTAAILSILLIPFLIASLMDFLKKSKGALMREHMAVAARATGRGFIQAVFTLLCLPHEAFSNGAAILRSGWLMLVSGKGLLEWNPPGEVLRANRTDFCGSLRNMWMAPVTALAVSGYMGYARSSALAVALPILSLWFISPLIAWWISKPLSPAPVRLAKDQILFLRKLSRRTWAFFEAFVGPEDHFLPPDNYQEEPLGVTAHRTSPTNMGLSLLSDLGACDFGYISAGQALDRMAKTLGTLEILEQYRGHFYNWYDTKDLKPLLPMYVSSVDSGNLAASLLTLRAGLLALPDEKLLGNRLFEGIADTAMILMEVAGGHIPADLAKFINDMEAPPPDRTLWDARRRLLLLSISATDAVHSAAAGSEALWWAASLAQQCRGALDELALLAPWVQPLPISQILDGFPYVQKIPTLGQLACLDEEMLPLIDEKRRSVLTPTEKAQLESLRGHVIDSSLRARERIAHLETLARRFGELAHAMEYRFLYDETRHLLSIGYNVSEGRMDPSFYDLLASEARLSSFTAIAQGQLPQESWFALGRLLTMAGGEPILLSWSGSMFEYLMPLLVMPTYDRTLLDQTCKAAVARQIEYGKKRGVPWGISESAYHMTDSRLNYQYKAFGVPGLGLKRGLAGDLVVAPYASALALMVAPEEACRNLETLAAQGFQGKYGFYDAIDYTPAHLSRGRKSAVVRSFMAHHQGMSLLSLVCLLLDRPMQKRFEADPMFQATVLLLQERIRSSGFATRHTRSPIAPDFAGFVTRMAGPELEDVGDVCKNLPLRIRDHMTNQPDFGPDGALYFPQGSSSSYGAADEIWGWRKEHGLTATILRLDTTKVTPGQPIDTITPDAGGTYDPHAPGAPLTIYSTGIRNAYDCVWHSNGHLYVPTNGSSAGGNCAGRGRRSPDQGPDHRRG